MPMLTTGEVTLHYQFDAKPGLPVLVLSNSLGTNFSMWAPQVAPFAQHFSLLRYDARGHGQSSLPAGPYSIEQMGRDVIALLDELKIERAHFCGLSMGGMVGQWLGANAPQRLRKLVLADTAAQSGDAEFWNTRIHGALEHGMEAAIPDVLGGWFTEGFAQARPEVIETTAAMLRATSPKGFAASCEAIRDMQLVESVAKIKVPTLVLYGRHDIATPPVCSEFLLEQIAGAEECVVNGAHISNLEDSEGFTQGVLRFLLK